MSGRGDDGSPGQHTSTYHSPWSWSARLVGREESVREQGLAAVVNLAFKKGLRIQRLVEAFEFKVPEGVEAKAVPLLALQQGRASHTLK